MKSMLLTNSVQHLIVILKNLGYKKRLTVVSFDGLPILCLIPWICDDNL